MVPSHRTPAVRDASPAELISSPQWTTVGWGTLGDIACMVLIPALIACAIYRGRAGGAK